MYIIIFFVAARQRVAIEKLLFMSAIRITFNWATFLRGIRFFKQRMKNIAEEKILAKAVNCRKPEKPRVFFGSEVFFIAEQNVSLLL